LTNKGTTRRFFHESVRHSGLGWLRCEVTTKAARVDGRSWGNGNAPALGGLKALPQAWRQGR
jgi:hypothetical protein